MSDIKRALEAIIRDLPTVINRHRKTEAFYDVYEASDIITRLEKIPPANLQELLLRNPVMRDAKRDLHAALTRMWESEMKAGCAFICSPLVFTVLW